MSSGLPHLRDVSSYQPHIDWKAEAKEVVAVYVKVTQGLTYVNPSQASEVKGARAAGLKVGCYHYATPGVGSGAQQADRLLKYAPGQAGQLRPCLDCEAPSNLNAGQLAAWYLGAVQEIVARRGFYPTIYGSPSYLQGFAIFHAEVFGRCPLWVADYGVTSPRVPAPWTSWAAWQWTPANRDPAIGSLVDDSYVADLPALLVPAPSVHRTLTKRAAKKAVPPLDSVPKASGGGAAA